MFAPLKSDTVTILAMHNNTLRHFSYPPNVDKAEIWAIGQHRIGRDYATRVFEGHEEAYILRRRDESSYLKHWIEELQEVAKEKPLYTRHHWGKSLGPYHYYFCPNVRKNTKGQPYIESTVGYMLACAYWAHKNVSPIKQIKLYGVSMDAQSEYAYQRPNALYWMGRLEEAGVSFYAPPECLMFASAFESGVYGLLENLPPQPVAKRLRKA